MLLCPPSPLFSLHISHSLSCHSYSKSTITHVIPNQTTWPIFNRHILNLPMQLLFYIYFMYNFIKKKQIALVKFAPCIQAYLLFGEAAFHKPIYRNDEQQH